MGSTQDIHLLERLKASADPGTDTVFAHHVSWNTFFPWLFRQMSHLKKFVSASWHQKRPPILLYNSCVLSTVIRPKIAARCSKKKLRHWPIPDSQPSAKPHNLLSTSISLGAWWLGFTIFTPPSIALQQLHHQIGRHESYTQRHSHPPAGLKVWGNHLTLSRWHACKTCRELVVSGKAWNV